MSVGWHIIAEFYDVVPDLLKTVPPVKKGLEKAASDAGLTILSSGFHQFQPYGVTGFLLLEESHISIHTWPEHNYLAADIFTCSTKEQTWDAFHSLEEYFKPGRVVHMFKERG